MKTSDASPTIPSPPAINRPVVVIYGGMHKTGTSSIQNTLYDNRQLLNANSVEIVQSGLETKMRETGVRHLPLSKEVGKTKSLGRLWAAAAAEVRLAKFNRYILMHENFFNPRLPPSVICSAFPNAIINLVVCIRNPIDYVQSQYKEKIHRVREFRDPGDFIKHNYGFIALKKLKSQWEREIGRDYISYVSYDQNIGAVEHAVIAQILAGTDIALDTIKISDRVNEKISDERCLKYLMINKLKRSGVEVDHGVVDRLPPLPDVNVGPSRLLSDSDIQRIADLADQEASVVESSAAKLPFNSAFFDTDIRHNLTNEILKHISASATAGTLLTTQERHDVTAHRPDESGGDVSVNDDLREKLSTARCLGVQREDHFVIELSSIEPLPESYDIIARMERPDGSQDLIRVSSSAAVAGMSLEDLTKRLTGRSMNLHSRRLHRAVFHIPVPTSYPVRAMTMSIDADGQQVQAPWLTQELSLALRIPQSPNEFRRYLSFRRGRNIDQETVFHCCRDILTTTLAENRTDVYAYLANCFVIFLYKALELGRNDVDQLVTQMLPRVRAIITDISAGKSIREDTYQASLSLDTALWHFWVARNNRGEFETTLRRMWAGYQDLAVPFKITYGYNLTISLLVFGAYLVGSKDPDGRRMLVAVYEVFKKAASSDTRHVIWFEELAISHRAALLALKAIEALSGSDRLPADLLSDAANHCARVKAEPFVKQVYAFMTDGRSNQP